MLEKSMGELDAFVIVVTIDKVLEQFKIAKVFTIIGPLCKKDFFSLHSMS